MQSAHVDHTPHERRVTVQHVVHTAQHQATFSLCKLPTSSYDNGWCGGSHDGLEWQQKVMRLDKDVMMKIGWLGNPPTAIRSQLQGLCMWWC